MSQRSKSVPKQSGFTLLEAMISILVLSFGVLSLGAIYSQGILYASFTQYDYIAEKKAEQAVEAIFTARDIKSLSWEDFFKKFDSEHLSFLYQDKTADGKTSRFYKFTND